MVTQMNHYLIGKTSTETLIDLIDLLINYHIKDDHWSFFILNRFFCNVAIYAL